MCRSLAQQNTTRRKQESSSSQLCVVLFALIAASLCFASTAGAQSALPVVKDAPTAQANDSTAPTATSGQPPTVSIQIMNPKSTGWVQLDGDDFVRVNGDDKTLVWTGGEALGSGQPIGVTRTKRQYENFEMVIQWMHLKPAGNSGVFAWVPPSALENLPPNKLPNSGIEIQMLDHGYTKQFTERTGRPASWFSTNGDIFAVGKSAMQPFPPKSPDGHRSFPSQETTNRNGQWNQYYVRAIDGEVRLWVNGVEVSGGRSCEPRVGYLCLESEGSPIRFRELWIRELPGAVAIRELPGAPGIRELPN